MLLFIAVFSAFIFSALAPWLHRYSPKGCGWVLTAYAGSLTAYFISQGPAVFAGKGPAVQVDWIPSLSICLSFSIDGLGLLMALLISGIGTLILLYSGRYFAGDARLGRFYMSLLMFLGSMLGVVLSDHLLVLFIFWELTSLSSYLLIGYNHEEAASRRAALQALLVTGAGGLCLLAGFVLIYVTTGTYEWTTLLLEREVLQQSPYYSSIVLLVLLGAFTKSAQMPFHFWLPSAMAAPTPVSAYLHSATMVKGGVFLLAHLSPVLGGTLLWKGSLILFGGMTLLIGSFMALTQVDLKRILAYSTVGTLGLLIFLIGIGTQEALAACMVFLLAHAFYKAGLFLVAGIVDHETGTRDVTQLSGLGSLMPLTFLGAALAGFSNAGFPLLFGFLAKESVYEATLSMGWGLTTVAVVGNIFLVGVGLLAGFIPFIGARKEGQIQGHEAPWAMVTAVLILGVLGLCLGIFPQMIGASLLSAAATAAYGGSTLVKLHLWHGWNMALLLSGITWAGGLLFVWSRNAFFLLREKKGFLAQQWGPAQWYDHFLSGLVRFSHWQTRLLQTGYQRHYATTLFVGTAGLVLLGFIRMPQEVWPPMTGGRMPFYEIFLVGLMLAALMITVRATNRLVSVVSLGVIGYGVSIIFAFYGAPDLAITQILVETLTLILIAVVVYRLPRFQRLSSWRNRIQDIVFSVGFGAIMTLLVLQSSAYQLHPKISEYFAQKSVPLAHGRNVVNVILVDFRALDTMGEITVLSVAALGVWALTKLHQGKKKKS